MDFNNNGPIAREGYPFIVFTLALALLLVVSSVFLGSLVLAIPAVLSVLVSAFVISFFRNPERVPPNDPAAVVAPADGTVIVNEVVQESPLGCAALKISIFMSVFNVHVNRSPFDGKVTEISYCQGRFFDARDGRASFENERNAVVLETPGGVKIAFVQIAGLIARRIICYPRVGDLLQRGGRYGLIRFGSRVDVFLPADVISQVRLGDLTVAGETVLGHLG